MRVRPRSTTGSPPATAPPDAAPLVSRPVRPRPVNPQSLSGQPVTTNVPRSTATPHPTQPATSPRATEPVQVAPAARPTPRPSPAPTLSRNTVVLDPGHGGSDSGSRIGDNILEKDVALAFAFRLRSLLAARGFNVVMTRESDAATAPNTPNTPLTLDDRAGIANHSRAAACLLLHATGRGTGVHLYTSELAPAAGEVSPQPWLTAQAAWVPASQQLERNLATALGRSHITLLSSAASVRPVDSLTCPALVLELAPEGSDPHSVTDAGYQERVAQAIAGALVFWQNEVQPPGRATASVATHTATRRRSAATRPAVAPEAQP